MDGQLVLALGVGAGIGVALQRWVIPKVWPAARLRVVRGRPVVKVPEGPWTPGSQYAGWGQYYSPSEVAGAAPGGPWPGSVPILSGLSDRPRAGGAASPSGEALGGF